MRASKLQQHRILRLAGGPLQSDRLPTGHAVHSSLSGSASRGHRRARLLDVHGGLRVPVQGTLGAFKTHGPRRSFSCADASARGTHAASLLVSPQHEVIEEWHRSGNPNSYKFFGKWLFKRRAGMYKIASVLFSLANLYENVRCGTRCWKLYQRIGRQKYRVSRREFLRMSMWLVRAHAPQRASGDGICAVL